MHSFAQTIYVRQTVTSFLFEVGPLFRGFSILKIDEGITGADTQEFWHTRTSGKKKAVSRAKNSQSRDKT